METTNDRYSIKTLLFTKAIPNYVAPSNLMLGHRVYPCTDCGDKFIFESSYMEHVNRKSVQITYMCRHCNQKQVFFNRCNLLCHIRSHVTKTATINVTDLNIEPLPASYFKVITPPGSKSSTTANKTNSSPSIQSIDTPRRSHTSTVHCFECKHNITSTGIAYKDRASHLMQYTNEVYSCPVCLFALPTTCALKTHIRIHMKLPPFYCAECGIHLASKNTNYPYHHDCEGFKMMRATARLKCIGPECHPLHPNDYKDHMKRFHLKRVLKCPFCVVACFSESTMQKHLKMHKLECKALLFYQCELCPGRFVAGNHLESHLKTHATVPIFPCWPCGTMFKAVSNLINHYIKKESKNNVINASLKSLCKENEEHNAISMGAIYRVVKRCDQCKRSFAYRCKYKEINQLPNECPYRCKSMLESNVTPEIVPRITKITCHLCKTKISQDWTEVKKHFNRLHKAHKCLDPEILVSKINIDKYISKNKNIQLRSAKSLSKKISKRAKSRQIRKVSTCMEVGQDIPSTSSVKLNSLSQDNDDSAIECNVCHDKFDSKVSLEKHMINHRDPCMAYQCMECGQSFVVKPTFAKHLLLEHNIADAEDYITKKQCYNEIALLKYHNNIVPSNEPVGENQCKICREEFECPEDLEKHFRVHGMAFLMKNNNNKNK